MAAVAASAAALCLAAGTALAADAPAGAQLQQPVPPQPAPLPRDAVLPAAPSARPAAPVAGGVQVTLQRVGFSGNTTLDDATLQAAIGPVQGRRFDMAGLQGLVDATARAYRERGYAFATALLPTQNLASGVLTIQVVEGRYGRISVAGTDPKVPQAQAFLDPLLTPGDTIREQPLERAMLLLNDQPGFRVQPVVQPGARTGEGDLIVNVQRRNHWSADIGLDNVGSRATGEHRARAAFQLNSPWRLGDRLSATALATDRRMRLGSLDYDAPLASRGTRVGIGLARTSYQIEPGVSPLSATGIANVLTLRGSHAFVRSQRLNLQLNVTLQRKLLRDDFGDGALVRDKQAKGLAASLQFDRRDGLGGGGITYGAVSTTAGQLALDADSVAADVGTAQSSGDYQKLNLDLARIQKLPGRFSAYGRLSAQRALKNLDSSEKYGVGGFLGVRAYPMGEASGDSGWLTQLELRLDLAAGVSGFVFYDEGHVKANQQPWDAAAENNRVIAGGGVGVRAGHEGWSLEAMAGWRTRGGAPTSTGDDRRPRIYVVLGHHWE